jgi:SAM-dependent methyltransferase
VGTVLDLLRREYPKSQLVGVDLSEEMLAWSHERVPSADLRRHDVSRRLFDDGSIDTFVLCSVLHEVFSYNGYDITYVRDALRYCAEALKPGGRLILRDGVQPPLNDVVYLTFRNEAARVKFVWFAKEFGSSQIPWKEVDGRVQVARRDAMEFLTKYIYDVNWQYEVKEHFGVLTLEGWVQEIRNVGLKPVHFESYLIEWLRKTHWEKDVKMEVQLESGYAPTDYPDSTMIVVGQK